MRSNIKPENRRLLEALYYIDEEVLSDVLSDISIPDPAAPAPRKRTVLRSVKYAALLAVCVMLVGAVIPVVSYLIERFPAGSKHYELTYPMFVEDLELLSDEEMVKINEVYEDWKYDQLYERYSSSVIGDPARADEQARNELGEDPHRFFNKDKYSRYQYYGKFGDCVVLATENYYYTLATFNVAGYEFELGGTADLLVYRNGEMMSLGEAYSSGFMTDAQIGAAHERYLKYQEYLNDNSDSEDYNTADTTEEKVDVEIPEYTPPEPTDEPYFWSAPPTDKPFTREEMLNIRAAYARYVFENKYISVYKETMEFWDSPDKAKERALEHATIEADYAASRFFRDNHITERCYGRSGDRVILALLGVVDGETVFKAADNEMKFSCGTAMYVYENGEIFDFVEYRENGGFTEMEELVIATRHWIYEAVFENGVKNPFDEESFTYPVEDYDLESYFGAEFMNDEYSKLVMVFGKSGDCLIAGIDTGITYGLLVQVGAYQFYYPNNFDIIVGCNGESYSLSMAYRCGYLNDFEIAKIYELYLDYCEREFQ